MDDGKPSKAKEQKLMAMSDDGRVVQELCSLNADKEPTEFGSFCGRGPTEYTASVQGPGVCICGYCVEICNNVIGSGEHGADT